MTAPARAALALALALGWQQAPAAPGGLPLEAYGGACDGVTDNNLALARGLADARARNLPLVIPVGQCNFSDIIRVDGAGLVGNGEGSVLYATNWQRSAIFMSGAAPSVSNLKLTGVTAPSRQAPWEMTKITVFGATDFTIDRVIVEGSPAAGIQTAQAPKRGRISNNIVRNTLSDGIHLTGMASHILVEGNLVEYTGDDGIAVVSYTRDAGRVNHITARNNVVRNNRFGRNMSVVGGTQVLYQNNLMQNNLAGLACLYIAQEGGSLPTQGNDKVKIERNTLQNCGSAATGHGAVLIFSDGLQPNNDIWLLRNDIRSGAIGIRAYSALNHGLRLEANRITGAWLPLQVSSPAARVVPYTRGPVGRPQP